MHSYWIYKIHTRELTLYIHAALSFIKLADKEFLKEPFKKANMLYCRVLFLYLRCGLLLKLKGRFRDLSGPSPLVKIY